MVSNNHIQSLDPFEFERLVADVWEAKGYSTTIRSKTGDRGVDVVCENVGYKVIIQAKCYSDGNNVGINAVRNYATLYQQIPDANEVVIVTSGGFTKEAKAVADKLNVELVNGRILSDYMREYDISVGDYDQINQPANRQYSNHEYSDEGYTDNRSASTHKSNRREYEFGTLLVIWTLKFYYSLLIKWPVIIFNKIFDVTRKILSKLF